MSQPPQKNPSILTVEITSFSYKAAIPAHLFSTEGERHGGGFVFDCRSLPNPGREEKFKIRTGLDADVCAYLEASPEVTSFRQHSFSLVESAVRNFLERDFTFMNVSFGCTGGQHRSVFFSEQLFLHLPRVFGERVQPKVIHHNLVAKGFIKG
jgi:RNase adaptor protein for sRNA GlmZ degradation